MRNKIIYLGARYLHKSVLFEMVTRKALGLFMLGFLATLDMSEGTTNIRESSDKEAPEDYFVGDQEKNEVEEVSHENREDSEGENGDDDEKEENEGENRDDDDNEYNAGYNRGDDEKEDNEEENREDDKLKENNNDDRGGNFAHGEDDDNDIKNVGSKCSNDLCEMGAQPVGCFYDSVYYDRPLPILLMTTRDKASPLHTWTFDWNDIAGSIKRLLCDCIEIAKKKGMTHVGLQHYGECWSSKTAEKDFMRQGKSSACKNGRFESCKKGELCVGEKNANYVYAINALNPVSCNIEYEQVGCYYDPVFPKRPLPYLLETDRDRTSHAFSGLSIQWSDYRKFLASTVCSCAQKARAKGYKYFGIQYYGECWSGPGGSSYNKFGPSSTCKSAALQKCRKGSTCGCTGVANSNFVYRLA